MEILQQEVAGGAVPVAKRTSKRGANSEMSFDSKATDASAAKRSRATKTKAIVEQTEEAAEVVPTTSGRATRAARNRK